MPSPINAVVGFSFVVSFEEARRNVQQHCEKLASRFETHSDLAEAVSLLSARGRVLAEDILADRDFPPFDRATRDGYAVRAGDLTSLPRLLEVVGELKAGDWPAPVPHHVTPGAAVAIMTGAPLPPGADAVVMVEHTSVAEGLHDHDRAAGLGNSKHRGLVRILRGVQPGENVVPAGAQGRSGQVLLDRKRRLDPSGVAIAASVGKSSLRVFRKPRVAVLSTGDELVGVDATPEPAQIRNSNSYSLAAQIQSAGAEPVLLPVAPDEPERLRELIQQGLACDLLLLTGGVSMGKYDLVEQALADLGAEFYFTGALIQPGRPVVFGSCPVPLVDAPSGAGDRRYFFGLPGNPVSTMVTFELFARSMIEALSGMAPEPLLFLRARLKSAIKTKTGLKRFLPAALSGEFENAEVELVSWQGSGDVASLARADCYVVVAPDRERIEAGEWVPLLLR